MTDKLIMEVRIAGGQAIDMKHRKLLQPLFDGVSALIITEMEKQHGIRLETLIYFK